MVTVVRKWTTTHGTRSQVQLCSWCVVYTTAGAADAWFITARPTNSCTLPFRHDHMHRYRIYHVTLLLLHSNNLRLYSAISRFKAEPAIFTAIYNAVYTRVVYKHQTTALLFLAVAHNIYCGCTDVGMYAACAVRCALCLSELPCELPCVASPAGCPPERPRAQRINP